MLFFELLPQVVSQSSAFYLLSRVICDKDPATGKSKCYTVCEYKDQETALMAVKGLNNFEMAGRLMKVDHAFNEKTRLEMICRLTNLRKHVFRKP